MAQAQLITRATHGDSLADILERVLNTGVVIVDNQSDRILLEIIRKPSTPRGRRFGH